MYRLGQNQTTAQFRAIYILQQSILRRKSIGLQEINTAVHEWTMERNRMQPWSQPRQATALLEKPLRSTSC
ncbi:hypothetical protein ASD74_20855 [Rhizobium sp. Root564]|nr:hypothetical protein ASD74_20855 [Rhizobium sp. Root564]